MALKDDIEELRKELGSAGNGSERSEGIGLGLAIISAGMFWGGVIAWAAK